MQISLFALRNKSNNHPESRVVRRPRGGQRDNIPIEIIEEREEVKAELNETFFFMPGECAEYLRCIVHVVLVSYPGKRMNIRLRYKVENNQWDIILIDIKC